MKLNFIIEDSVAIEMANNYFDIHNDYDLSEVVRQEGQKTFCILFKKREAKWVRPESPKYIFLLFLDVSYLNVELLSLLPAKVEEIGFKDSDDFNLDWLSDKQPDENDAHIIFRLENGGFIRIGSETSLCRLAE